MMREDCEFNTEWNSTPEQKLNSFYTQRDWNQSLITKINMMATQIAEGTLIGSGNKIILHPTNRGLIESLEYYDVDRQILSGRFNVVFDDQSDNNVIFVINDKIENPGHIFFKVFGNGDMRELQITFDPNEIRELKKKYCAYIEIKRNFRFLR